MAKIAKLVRVLGRRPYRSALLRYGVAASVEHERALSGLGCRTVVDIGAHTGQFTLLARSCFPEARIIAFEPLPGPARRFARVHEKNSGVTLYNVAVGPERGQAGMHVSRRDDSSSLLPIGQEQERVFPGTGQVATLSVSVAPLADLLSADEIEAPALLKLDVQGYELEVLKGCENLLQSFRFVYVECSFVELYCGQALASDVIDWLLVRGYTVSGIHNLICDREGRQVQADFLFERTEAPSSDVEDAV